MISLSSSKYANCAGASFLRLSLEPAEEFTLIGSFGRRRNLRVVTGLICSKKMINENAAMGAIYERGYLHGISGEFNGDSFTFNISLFLFILWNEIVLQFNFLFFQFTTCKFFFKNVFFFSPLNFILFPDFIEKESNDR